MVEEQAVVPVDNGSKPLLVVEDLVKWFPLTHGIVFKKHIGFYPVPRGVAEFMKELSRYEGDKSTARFPLDQPPPLDLIERIVRFRVEKNLEKAEAKRKKR